jgi:hypothetical protein
VGVVAESDDQIVSVAANLNLGGNAAVSGAASVYVLGASADNQTKATVESNVVIDAGGNVTVRANGDVGIDLTAGGGGFGGDAGIGAANSTLVTHDRVEAHIGQGSDVTSQGTVGVTVSATSVEDLQLIAVGGGPGRYGRSCRFRDRFCARRRDKGIRRRGRDR